MAERRDTETLWHLIGPWILPALSGALMPLLLRVVMALGPLRGTRMMIRPIEVGAWLPLAEPARSVAMAAGGVYWISGVLLAIAPQLVQGRDLGGRERAADLLFVMPMLSTTRSGCGCEITGGCGTDRGWRSISTRWESISRTT